MRLPFKIVPIFKIRVIYKSGYAHDFWAWDFKVTKDSTHTNFNWVTPQKGAPLLFGDDVAAVWQLRHRWTIKRNDAS